MTRSKRVNDNDLQIRVVEWEIIVSAIPQNDISLLLSLAQNLLIIYASVDDVTYVDVRLIFFPLFNRTLISLQVIVRSETLANLIREYSVRHRVTDNNHPPKILLERSRNGSRNRALTNPSPDTANGNHRQI